MFPILTVLIILSTTGWRWVIKLVRYRWSHVALLLSLSAAAAAAQEGGSGPNWLLNPWAEIHPVTVTGWRPSSGDWTKPKSGTAGASGQAFFWGGAHPRAELYQEISLAALSAWLADGAGTAVFRGYLGSWKDDADSSQVYLEALGANGAVLRSATTGAKNHDTWTLETFTLPLPATTAALRLRLVAVRVAGNDNNGYFDDLELRVVGPDGRPPVIGARVGGQVPAATAFATAGTRTPTSTRPRRRSG